MLATIERGIYRREVSGPFGISLATIGHYVERKAKDEQITPKPSPGRKVKMLGVRSTRELYGSNCARTARPSSVSTSA